MEHKLTCDEVDLIFTGFWEDDHFFPTGVRLADPAAIMEDEDYMSDIDAAIRQEDAEKEYEHAEVLIRGLQEWKSF